MPYNVVIVVDIMKLCFSCNRNVRVLLRVFKTDYETPPPTTRPPTLPPTTPPTTPPPSTPSRKQLDASTVDLLPILGPVVFVVIVVITIIFIYRKRHKNVGPDIENQLLNPVQDEYPRSQASQPSDADEDAGRDQTQQFIDGVTGGQMTHRINDEPISANQCDQPETTLPTENDNAALDEPPDGTSVDIMSDSVDVTGGDRITGNATLDHGSKEPCLDEPHATAPHEIEIQCEGRDVLVQNFENIVKAVVLKSETRGR